MAEEYRRGGIRGWDIRRRDGPSTLALTREPRGKRRGANERATAATATGKARAEPFYLGLRFRRRRRSAIEKAPAERKRERDRRVKSARETERHDSPLKVPRRREGKGFHAATCCHCVGI